MRKGLWLLLAAALFLTLGAAQSEKRYWAERFDVTAGVFSGGDLQVHETVVFNFQGGPFTYVFRELPTQATDGIVDIQARVDGRALPEGDGPGQVEIAYGDPLRITWHMEQTSNTSRTFDLDYRMLGVVRQDQNADLLWWRPLPAEYEYSIASSQTVISYPAEWPLVARPSVEKGQASAAVEPGRMVVNAAGLGPDEALEIMIPFQPGSVLADPPAWQARQQEAARQEAQRQAEQNERAWIWVTLGGLVLAGGTALLYRTLGRYRRQVPEIQGKAYEPPGDVAPALAGALRSKSAGATWELALATLFDLAGRGYLAIEQLPKRRWRGHDFLIRRLGKTGGLRPLETALMALLLEDKRGNQQESVEVSRLNNLVSNKRWKRFEKSLESELIAAGLFSQERQKARGWIMGLSLVPLLLALAVSLFMMLFRDTFGVWPMVVAAALLLVTILWAIGGATISALSDQGAWIAAKWEPFYRYLKAVSKGQAAPANEDEFEAYLPFATAYGLLHSWAKRFEKRGWTETPAYFRPLQSAGQRPMAAFVAMTAATSSSGGSASTGAAGAGGGAGAAGGGASGAG